MTNQLATRPGALQAPQLDYILMDGSLSMQEKWWDSMAALDGFMSVLKARNIHSHGIASVFAGSTLSSIQRDSMISSWRTFSDEPLTSPWGRTPLYDAINNMARHMRDLDPPNASIVIVTDGDEFGSTHTTADQARAMLDWCRAKGWQVTFLGCDFNNEAQARMLGADKTNSIGVQRKLLADAGKVLGQKRANHAQSGEDINFSPEEQSTFGGYLAGPSK